MKKQDLLPKNALELFSDYKPDDSKLKFIVWLKSSIYSRRISNRVEKIRKKYEQDIIYRIKRKERFAIPRIDTHPRYTDVINSINESAIFLDAGCGCGWDLRRIIKDGLRIENAKGIDVDPFLRQINFELYKDEEIMGKVFEIGNALSTRFESSSFDIIHSGSVIHALEKRNKVMKYLQEMYRILRKPDGIFFGRTLGDYHEKEYSFIRRGLYVSTYEKLKEYLDKVGFRKIDIRVEELHKEAIHQPSYMLHFFANT